jgi:CheY-like chemotaxis protein
MGETTGMIAMPTEADPPQRLSVKSSPPEGVDMARMEDHARLRVTPLYRGLTMLAVEDSRYAAEALRLMCRKLGLRLRRAEDLRNAHLHLRLYRPDVVLVDLGLPDGRGEALVQELVTSPWRPRAVLATSGDPAGRHAALAAGADGFIDKPLENFAAFRAVLARFLPEVAGDLPPLAASLTLADEPVISPDLLALRDDLVHAAAVLAEQADADARRYLAGFLGGVARHAHDQALAEAAEAAGQAPLDQSSDRLKGMLARRLAAPDGAFRDSEGQGGA